MLISAFRETYYEGRILAGYYGFNVNISFTFQAVKTHYAHPTYLVCAVFNWFYDFWVYINNSLHLARKYARIFVCRHYLFLEANSFRERGSRKTVRFEEQNVICSSKLTVLLERSRKTVRFSEQTMSADKYPRIFSCQMEAIVYIFSLQMETIVFIILQICYTMCGYPPFFWGIFGHVTCLDQSRASENIWWIIIRDN